MLEQQAKLLTGLAVALMVTVGVLAYVDPPESGGDEDERWESPFDGIERTEVTAFERTTSSGETLRIVKDGAGWTFQEPFEAKADTRQVEDAIDEVLKLRVSEPITTSGKPADFGLDPVQATTTLQGPKAPVMVELGRRAPAGYRTYLRVGGDPALRASERALDTLTQPAESFRDRRVVELEVGRVVGLDLVVGDATFHVAKTAEGFGEHDARVQALLRQLADLRASGFRASLPPSTPDARWTLTRDDGTTTTVEATQVEPDLWTVHVDQAPDWRDVTVDLRPWANVDPATWPLPETTAAPTPSMEGLPEGLDLEELLDQAGAQ